MVRNKEVGIKLFKFCLVGATGAVITWGMTYLLTEKFGLWYMFSVILATTCAIPWNFTWNLQWPFRQYPTTQDPEYERYSFYHGNPIQKWWKRSIAKTIWDWIPTSSELLDIGSGSSPIITHYPNAYAIDTNDKKLKFIKGRVTDIKIGNMSAESLLFADGRFDYVLFIELIEHLIHPEKTIAEISCVLKHHGKVVIATPDYSRPLWHIAEQFTLYKDEHIYKFNRMKLEQMCIDNGLMPIKHKYIATCDLLELFMKV